MALYTVEKELVLPSEFPTTKVSGDMLAMFGIPPTGSMDVVPLSLYATRRVKWQSPLWTLQASRIPEADPTIPMINAELPAVLGELSIESTVEPNEVMDVAEEWLGNSEGITWKAPWILQQQSINRAYRTHEEQLPRIVEGFALVKGR